MQNYASARASGCRGSKPCERGAESQCHTLLTGSVSCTGVNTCTAQLTASARAASRTHTHPCPKSLLPAGRATFVKSAKGCRWEWGTGNSSGNQFVSLGPERVWKSR